jgi:CelD/BcsL family acetyltransferase involved in cellulose biosynthesis
MEQGMNQLAATLDAFAEPITPSVPIATGRITVEVRRDLDLRPDDAAALEALIESRPQVGVFVSRAWLSGWFAEPPRGVEPGLMLLRDGQLLRGVVPMAVRATRTQVYVGLLGGGIGSDRVDLLVARGFETACADAFVSWISDTFERRGYIIELRDVPGESPLWGALLRRNAGATRPWAFHPREIYTLPYLDLIESPVRPMKSLDKHQRWLERKGRLRIELLQDPSEALRAFESLSGFLHARWAGDAAGSVLDCPRTARFHRHVIPQLLREGRLRMIRLSSDMRPVAVFYGLATGSWWGYYLAGYDREWAGRIHLGQLNLNAAIDMASQEGAAEFDFLKGVERVKYLWPVRERPALDADAYSAHWRSQSVRAAHAARDTAAALIKSARGLFSSPSPQ